jgi:ankyrin repeat protein
MDEIDWSDLEALRRERPALVLELMTAGDADAFRRAVEAGFDVNVLSDFGGATRTPLHHAAGAGDLEAVRILLEAGADPSAVDPEFNATPLGWAEFFEKPEAAAALRVLS